MSNTPDESLIANQLIKEFTQKHGKITFSTSDTKFYHDLDILRQELKTFTPMSEEDSNEFKSLYLDLANQRKKLSTSPYFMVFIDKPLSTLRNGTLFASLIIGTSIYFKIGFLSYLGYVVLILYACLTVAAPKVYLMMSRTIKFQRMLAELPSVKAED